MSINRPASNLLQTKTNIAVTQSNQFFAAYDTDKNNNIGFFEYLNAFNAAPAPIRGNRNPWNEFFAGDLNKNGQLDRAEMTAAIAKSLPG